MKNIFLIVIAILITACNSSSKIDGTYVTQDGRELTLKTDGTAIESKGGKVIDQFKYEVDGKKIKTEGRLWQLTISESGSIESLVYGEMKKK